MTIAWDLFAPWHALAGGALIGLASGLYVLGNGRIAGVCGIVAGPLLALFARTPMTAERTRLLFLAGLLVAPWVWRAAAPLPAPTVDSGPVALIVAGFLVGVGARMANGCTSGHGVCGLSRFSLRSLVNVLVFIGAGVATLFVLRHVL
jgi:uncharacterized membrane protein YedE/YeeE